MGTLTKEKKPELPLFIEPVGGLGGPPGGLGAPGAEGAPGTPGAGGEIGAEGALTGIAMGLA